MFPKRETLQYGYDFDSTKCHQEPLGVGKRISIYENNNLLRFDVRLRIRSFNENPPNFEKALPERNRACLHRQWMEFKRRKINTSAVKLFRLRSVCLPNGKTPLPTKSLRLQPNANANNSALNDRASSFRPNSHFITALSFVAAGIRFENRIAEDRSFWHAFF